MLAVVSVLVLVMGVGVVALVVVVVEPVMMLAVHSVSCLCGENWRAHPSYSSFGKEFGGVVGEEPVV